jgi:hypothetical protein
MAGLKHLIQCHCVLPIYRKRKEPLFHKFVVYSKTNDEGEIVEKLSRCNNCAAVHRIIDFCKSEIVFNMEDTVSVTTADEIRESLPEKIVKILDENKCDFATYENVEDVLFEERWGEIIILSRQKINNEKTQIKTLEIKSDKKFRIKAEIVSLFTDGE